MELADLVNAFKAAEPNLAKGGGAEQLAVLISDDPDEGLDAEAIRVLGAWINGDHKWTKPKSPCPDGGRPTKAAYDWMVRGMNLDYVAIADAAGVTRSVARAKMAKLLGARLIYGDGTIAKAAKAAMEASIARRVRAKPQKQQPQPQPQVVKPGTN